MSTVKTSVLRFTEPLRGNFRTLSTLTKLLLILTLLLPSVPGAMTQDANPTIAILRYGPLSSYMVTEGAILDMLETYELINAEERAVLDERRGLEGENINIIWGDGNFDVPTVNLIIEDALDQEADVLLTLSRVGLTGAASPGSVGCGRAACSPSRIQPGSRYRYPHAIPRAQ